MKASNKQHYEAENDTSDKG